MAKEKRCLEVVTSPKIPFGGGSMIFWGDIYIDALIELVPIRVRSMNADYYLENIVVQHIEPFASFVGSNFVLMQDNACPHVV